MCHKRTTGQIFTLANILECCDQDPPIISPLTTSQVTGDFFLWFGRAHLLDAIICTISRHVQKEILHDKFKRLPYYLVCLEANSCHDHIS